MVTAATVTLRESSMSQPQLVHLEKGLTYLTKFVVSVIVTESV